jgi:diguanylate cyclase
MSQPLLPNSSFGTAKLSRPAAPSAGQEVATVGSRDQDAHPQGLAHRLADLALTRDRSRRLRLLHSGLACFFTVCCALLAVHASALVGVSPVVAWSWAGVSVGGIVAVYLAVRLDMTRGMDDPGLTSFQVIFSILSAAFAYGMLGPMRAIAIPSLMMSMLFGLTALSPRKVAAMGLFAVLTFGGVMLLKSHQVPALYPPRVEMVHFLACVLMVPLVPVLASRYALMHARQVQQASKLAHAQALASRDELTGLINRREMTHQLQRAQMRSVAHPSHPGPSAPFCVAVIDLDHFKRVNDTHGHGVGDEVLRRFASVAQATVRGQDLLARWGGEEFVLLLGDTSLQEAHGVVSRLRESIASLRMRVGSADISISFSAGLAESVDHESQERLLSRADAAMYAAKAQGRNAVVCAEG